MNKILGDESGMTLMELILSIMLLAIIGLAAFGGFQYAFTTMSAIDKYSENIYITQEKFEDNLSYAYTTKLSQVYSAYKIAIDEGEDPVDELNTMKETLFGVDSGPVNVTSIDFSWDNTKFVAGAAVLNDFESFGLVVEETSEGGTYLEKDSYTFVPIYNQLP